MHEQFMKEALIEAQKAYELDEVPVGAIIVYRDKIIARAHNTRETMQNPIHHAEILAIQEAAKHLGTWKLNDCTLYVTLEPCIMCAGSIIQSRVGTVVFGAFDSKGGSFGSNINLLEVNGFNHYPDVISGVLKNETAEILTQYFKEKREKQCVVSLVQDENTFDSIKAIRKIVFVDEQHVDPEIEYDEYDSLNRDDVIHLIATIKGKPVGTLRLIKEGNKLTVGRVAVLKYHRNQGIGKKLMLYAEKYACNNGFESLSLGAQLTAIPFYEKSGYSAYGDIFLDADIEHRMMVKKCK